MLWLADSGLVLLIVLICLRDGILVFPLSGHQQICLVENDTGPPPNVGRNLPREIWHLTSCQV